MARIDVHAVAAAITESIAFDANLDENAGGTGVFAEGEPCEVTLQGDQTSEMLVSTSDGSRWLLTLVRA